MPPFWQQEDSSLASSPGDGRTFEWGSQTDFEAMAQSVVMASAPVAACVFVRMAVFSEARFAFQRFEGGRPQEPFTTDALAVLEEPWPGASTGDLLARMEMHASVAGNCYVARVGDQLRVLRPDRVRILVASKRSAMELDARVIGYGYTASGEMQVLQPDQVAHYAPIPDPLAQWRGMSWLTPVLREVQADDQATKHKLGFFKRGATPSMVVSYDPQVSAQEFEQAVDWWRRNYEGADNAYRVLHVAGGADPKPLSFDFSQLDFARLAGRAETRIAAAAGVHPVIVGFSEGLQGSSLNAGNYAQVRRRFVDGTLRPLWRAAAEALGRLVDVPAGARLWYDDRDIAFLRQDVAEEARIRQTQAQTIVTLIRDGFEPESAVEAVITGDLRRLRHTGLVSVQLQPPLPVQEG
jgi:HK97 family phage portal protein